MENNCTAANVSGRAESPAVYDEGDIYEIEMLNLLSEGVREADAVGSVIGGLILSANGDAVFPRPQGASDSGDSSLAVVPAAAAAAAESTTTTVGLLDLPEELLLDVVSFVLDNDVVAFGDYTRMMYFAPDAPFDPPSFSGARLACVCRRMEALCLEACWKALHAIASRGAFHVYVLYGYPLPVYHPDLERVWDSLWCAQYRALRVEAAEEAASTVSDDGSSHHGSDDESSS